MKNLISIICLILVLSCGKTTYKTMDFDSFQLSVPKNWSKYELSGIDSYVGGLITNKNDTLFFDLGWHSPDYSNQDFPLVFDSTSLTYLTKEERILLPQTKHLILDSITGDVNFEEYLIYETSFDSIDCFKAKFILPKNKGYGATGIYIDSLAGGDTFYNKIKFGFYGKHLSDDVQADFITAIKSIKFKEYCSQQHIKTMLN